MILALDVAFANLGWVAIDKGKVIDFGTIVTEKDKRRNVKVSDDYAARCAKLGSELNDIIQKYKPKGIVAETPAGSQSATSAKLLGGAVCAVSMIGVCYDIPIEWITEGDSKKAALGVRKAVKEDVMDWARNQFPDVEFPEAKKWFEHVADALMAYNGLRNGVLVRAFG